MFVKILWVLGLAIAGTATWLGLPYYLTPLDQRPFSPMHDLYAPTGLIGHGYGIIGSLLVVVGVILYAARKRVPFLARVGKLRDWLHFHIFLCLVGPYLVFLHTTLKFGGLVAISFWSMAAVVASGIFGRYVYGWIPKTINGQFIGAQDIRGRMHALVSEVERTTSLTSDQLMAIIWPRGRPDTDRRAPRPEPQRAQPSPVAASSPTVQLEGVAKSVDALFKQRDAAVAAAPAASALGNGASVRETSQPSPGKERRRRSREPGILRAASEAAFFRVGRRRRRSRFNRELRAVGVAEPIRSEIVQHLEEEARIEQQIRILKPFQRAFRYWHAFHLPLALVMFLVLGVHVAVALAFGYTWVF